MQGTNGRGWRWWVGRAGRVLIASGILVLLFAAYQLWGTGIQAARAQDRAELGVRRGARCRQLHHGRHDDDHTNRADDLGPGDHRAADHGAARDRPTGTAGG